jgi:hypothetical protein
LNPQTGEIENLERLVFSTRLWGGEALELPVIADLRLANRSSYTNASGEPRRGQEDRTTRDIREAAHVAAPSCQRRVHDRVLLDDELPRIEQIAHRVVQLVGRRT